MTDTINPPSEYTAADAAEILEYVSGPSKRTAEPCVKLKGDIAKTAFDTIIRACKSHDALVAFVGKIARMNYDGEEIDDGDTVHTFDMSNDDTFEAFSGIIEEARGLVAGA